MVQWRHFKKKKKQKKTLKAYSEASLCYVTSIQIQTVLTEESYKDVTYTTAVKYLPLYTEVRLYFILIYFLQMF